MAPAQYFLNSGMCAAGLAIKAVRLAHLAAHYLWTSITYLSGAALAAIASNSIDRIGLSIVSSEPIIVIVYFTYNKYLNEIKATSAMNRPSANAELNVPARG
jgi:hypothetical protein